MNVGKSRFVLPLLAALFMSLVFVSAQTSTSNVFDPLVKIINSIFTGLFSIISSLFGQILGSTISSNSTYFYGAILLTIILFALVFNTMKAANLFILQPWITWVISIAVAVLGVRFLTPELIATIILPYSALGVAVTAGLPFVLFFIMIEGLPTAGGGGSGIPAGLRKFAWIFFGIIFIAIYSIRANDGTFGSESIVSYIYPLTALLSFIMILIDGTYQRWLANMQMQRATAVGKNNALTTLMNERTNIHTHYSQQGGAYRGSTTLGTGLTGAPAYKRDLADVEQRIKTLMSS